MILYEKPRHYGNREAQCGLRAECAAVRDWESRRGYASELSHQIKLGRHERRPSHCRERTLNPEWRQYQEKAAAFFRSLGLEAETDVTVKGIRTTHDVDVVVRSHHVGFDITWLVECKHWKSAVSKLHVLALREIVADTGADRGILLAEAGFQSGALEAASLTNVQLTSLQQLIVSASDDILSMRLRELFDRNDICKERYWKIPKQTRIEYGLRFDVGTWGYSGRQIIIYVADVLSRAFRGQFPVVSEVPLAKTNPELALPDCFTSPAEVVAKLEKLVSELESKLSFVESKFHVNRHT